MLFSHGVDVFCRISRSGTAGKVNEQCQFIYFTIALLLYDDTV